MPHDHDHDHVASELDAMTARVMALETILTEKGLVDPAALDAIVDAYERQIGPRNGARVVARAWSDPGFADWLRRDATAAIASLGYSGRQGEHMRAVLSDSQCLRARHAAGVVARQFPRGGRFVDIRRDNGMRSQAEARKQFATPRTGRGEDQPGL